MERTRTRLRSALRSAILISFALIGPVLSAYGATDAVDVTSEAVKKSVTANGRARVIIRLRTTELPATGRPASTDREQERRLDIATRQQRIRQYLRGTNHSVRREFRSLPYIVVEVDAAGLARLQQAIEDIAQIVEDPLVAPALASSIPQIEADIAHAQGYNGSGSVIAIVDTGVDNAHPFLAGKVIDEACFADREQPTDPGSCPNGSNQQFGAGAAVPCAFTPATCQHGTHVAGIAAGSGATPGVAPSANLFALQVFHRSTQCSIFEDIPCARAFSSDITAALEYVYERRALYNLASVNMSLGGALAPTPCDSLVPTIAAVIDNLKAAGIATVIASGNGSDRSMISFPACIGAAIAVGAVGDDDSVAFFSNVAEGLDLFAPGVGIVSSVPGGGFESFSGTSMATPHVAGAWAVMRQANPLASVDDVLGSFVDTGKPI
ncbi:MAG TPA: S8 family serine peptidase, partial [Steroidobacteraceae bacterium]|nr:S8 family serine peptidase [Steroidobacteraceae bacterium]